MIDKVTVCGKEFDIIEAQTNLGDGTVRVVFSVNIDGVERTLKLEYTTEMVEALGRIEGINAEAELQSIVIQEIKLSIFELIHKVSLTEITSGQKPDLIKDFVSEFGAGYIESEAQEKYMDLIAEALQ